MTTNPPGKYKTIAVSLKSWETIRALTSAKQKMLSEQEKPEYRTVSSDEVIADMIAKFGGY